MVWRNYCRRHCIGHDNSAQSSKKRGMDTDVVLDVLLLAIPLAIIGARAAYVFSHFEYYGQNPLSIFAFREGGLAIHGGIAGGIAGIIIMCKIKNRMLGL